MPTRSRRRSGFRPPSSGPKTEETTTLQPGRFSDVLLTCETCGSPFVWTVEEQRRLDAAGLPQIPPTQCPRCAPRAAVPAVEPEAEVEAPPARSSYDRPSHRDRRTHDDYERGYRDEFEVHYVVRSLGHVTWYDADKGEGSITDDDDGREYHVRRSALEGGARGLQVGQAVEYELMGRGWEAEAVHVLII